MTRLRTRPKIKYGGIEDQKAFDLRLKEIIINSRIFFLNQ